MLLNYIKIAWKVLGRNKFFTFVSLFGISFTLAILIVVVALMNNFMNPSYPEPFRDRTLYVNQVKQQSEDKSSVSISAAGFHLIDHYLKKMETPEKVGMIQSYGTTSNTFLNNQKITLECKLTDEVIWEIFDFEFLQGKPYNAANIKSNDYVAVISNAARAAYFGDQQDVLGESIELDNMSYKVIGVVKNAAQAPPFPASDVYIPYNTSMQKEYEKKEFRGSFVGVLLAEKVSDIPAIREELQDIISRIELPADELLPVLSAKAVTMVEQYARMIARNDDENAVAILFAIVIGGMLLFIMLPTLNLININVSRIMERASEIGVRKAFGATASTLARQFIVENIILTLIGGAIGLLIAYGALQIIETIDVIKYSELKIDFNVFLIAILLCLLFGILSGVLPAVRMSRMQVVNAIKGEIK